MENQFESKEFCEGTHARAQMFSAPSLAAGRETIEAFMHQFLPCVEAALSEVGADKNTPRRIYERYKSEFFLGPQSPLKFATSGEQEMEEYILTMSHTCISQACDDSACMLCSMNPIRPCGNNFMQEKYFEHGNLFSKCGQPFYIELKKKASGEVAKLDGELVLALADGQAYNRGFHGVYPLCSSDFERYLLLSHKGTNVLYCSPSSHARVESDGVHITMKGGIAKFPADLKISVSSNSLFGNKSGCYRLITRIVSGSGQLPPANWIGANISPSFTTLTQRSKSAQKKDRPLYTDEINKLDKLGQKRLERLKDLGNYLDLPFMPQSVTTVADLQQLARYMNEFGDVKQKILGCLGISEEDWGIICGHADQAIYHDTRMRCWKPVNGAGRINKLIYKCSSAQVDFNSGPVALQYGRDVILKRNWTSGQHCQAQKLDKLARDYWWEPEHCGWSILPMTLEKFEEFPSAAAEDMMNLESVSLTLSSISMDVECLDEQLGDSLPVPSPFEKAHCQALALPTPSLQNMFSDSLPDSGNLYTLKAEHRAEDPHRVPIKPDFSDIFDSAKQEEPERLVLDEKSSKGLQGEIPWLSIQGFPVYPGMCHTDQAPTGSNRGDSVIHDENSQNNIFHSTISSDLDAQFFWASELSRNQMLTEHRL